MDSVESLHAGAVDVRSNVMHTRPTVKHLYNMAEMAGTGVLRCELALGLLREVEQRLGGI